MCTTCTSAYTIARSRVIAKNFSRRGVLGQEFRKVLFLLLPVLSCLRVRGGAGGSGALGGGDWGGGARGGQGLRAPGVRLVDDEGNGDTAHAGLEDAIHLQGSGGSTRDGLDLVMRRVERDLLEREVAAHRDESTEVRLETRERERLLAVGDVDRSRHATDVEVEVVGAVVRAGVVQSHRAGLDRDVGQARGGERRRARGAADASRRRLNGKQGHRLAAQWVGRDVEKHQQ